MTLFIMKLFVLLCLGLQQITAQGTQVQQSYLDVETPAFFNYNSPLKQPDSLRSQPYYDFLSTLYRRDTQKSGLFQPYAAQNSRRQTRAAPSPVVPQPSAHLQPPYYEAPISENHRAKRAVVFRPLFVYRQQQLQKQQTRRRY